MIESTPYPDVKNFPWVQILRYNYQNILDEYLRNVKRAEAWPDTDIYTGNWEAIVLRYQYDVYDENTLNFYRTIDILKSLNLKIPTIGFSILNKKTKILPHTNAAANMNNTAMVLNTDILRCHLCLKTNDNCGLTVGGETRHWEEGNIIIFDDSYEHSAYNDGDSERVVLLFDFDKNNLPK